MLPLLLVVVGLTGLAGEEKPIPFQVSGLVYEDLDHDRAYDEGEPTLPGVTVAWEDEVYSVTDASGRYTLEAPDGGIVWARTPEGYAVRPPWIRVIQGIDLGNLPMARWGASGPLTFVHASDSHIGDYREVEGEIVTWGLDPVDSRAAILQAARGFQPAPHFLTITGDITQDDSDAQFWTMLEIRNAMPVPFLPVIGNHDGYDGGGTYRRYLGPQMYSFQTGGVHGIVLDLFEEEEAIAAFLERDLANVPDDRPRVVFMHVPRATWVDTFERFGIDVVISGHWHSNRVIDYGGIVEVNTQPIVMGGADFTPAGYRVIQVGPDGLQIRHHTVVDGGTFLAAIHPRPDECVPAGPLEVIAAAEAGPSLGQVIVSLDGEAPVALAARGGWTWSAPFLVAEGAHELTLEMRWGADRRYPARQVVTSRFCVTPAATVPRPFDWPQLGGSAAHAGYTPVEVRPPLTTAWARTVGGHLRGGSPVLAGGLLYVPVIDLADGAQGGVVALDARTGERVWERRVGWSVHGAPAVEDGVVVFGSAEGTVHAVDARSGEALWTHDLGDGLEEDTVWLYAGPAIAEGLVYIGVLRRFAALDLVTGERVWEVDPTGSIGFGSYAHAAVSRGTVVAAFGRDVDGVVAWDAWDGRELWRLPQPYSNAVNASPVFAEGSLFLGNAATQVIGIDLERSGFLWETHLMEELNEWSYGIAATPAVAHGRIYVPTQYDEFLALDQTTGRVEWSELAEPSVIHPVHYKAAARAFASSPVVTGDVVWLGGADGVLRAHDARSGERFFTADLGAPILSGLVPGGCVLYAGTWDGTVRAMVPAAGTCTAEAPPPPRACSCGVGTRSAPAPWGLLLALLLYERRRRTRT